MGYCDDKAPDSRIAHIRATSEKAEAMPDPTPCEKCGGMGEIAVLDDEGKPTSGKHFCEDCKGTGAVL